jgi:glutathione S-transferase
VSAHVSYGDNVRILRTDETERLGIVEMIGNVYGETTPSESKVEVIGKLQSDYALKVYFETLQLSYWFAPQLLEFVNHAPGTEILVHGSSFKSVRQPDGTWKDIPIDQADASVTTAPAILITIPLSHYCEKARWALDRVALPYREEPHAPLFNRLATKRNDGGTVPVLVHGSHRFIDSTDILMYADAVCGGDLLYPRDKALRREVEAFEERFDTELGPHVRRWAYGQLLPHPKLLRSLWSRGVPRLEATFFPLIAPLVRRVVRAVYKITPEGAQRSLERVRGVFRQVDECLSDGRRFLAGQRFTAADLTFAALAAPILFPVECRAVHPALDDVPIEMHKEVLRMRNTDAGHFALRMFSRERGFPNAVTEAPAA